MTNAQREALLRSAMADLRKTEHGYKPTNGGGPNWTNAFRKLEQLRDDLAAPPSLLMVFPIPEGSGGTVNVTGGLHPTAGLVGNWALDFMCKGGTPIVAVEPAKIKKLSGRDPALGSEDFVGIFGWNIHYETAAGYRYFSTHYGFKLPTLRVGQQVEAGDLLGRVGLWPGNPPRSHLHLGVTSPLGVADAKRHIQAVARSPRIH